MQAPKLHNRGLNDMAHSTHYGWIFLVLKKIVLFLEAENCVTVPGSISYQVISNQAHKNID